jgi:hypothetical protein
LLALPAQREFFLLGGQFAQRNPGCAPPRQALKQALKLQRGRWVNCATAERLSQHVLSRFAPARNVSNGCVCAEIDVKYFSDSLERHKGALPLWNPYT